MGLGNGSCSSRPKGQPLPLLRMTLWPRPSCPSPSALRLRTGLEFRPARHWSLDSGMGKDEMMLTDLAQVFLITSLASLPEGLRYIPIATWTEDHLAPRPFPTLTRPRSTEERYFRSDDFAGVRIGQSVRARIYHSLILDTSPIDPSLLLVRCHHRQRQTPRNHKRLSLSLHSIQYPSDAVSTAIAPTTTALLPTSPITTTLVYRSHHCIAWRLESNPRPYCELTVHRPFSVLVRGSQSLANRDHPSSPRPAASRSVTNVSHPSILCPLVTSRHPLRPFVLVSGSVCPESRGSPFGLFRGCPGLSRAVTAGKRETAYRLTSQGQGRRLRVSGAVRGRLLFIRSELGCGNGRIGIESYRVVYKLRMLTPP